jgi:outer membrane immunogenic protein
MVFGHSMVPPDGVGEAALTLENLMKFLTSTILAFTALAATATAGSTSVPGGMSAQGGWAGFYAGAFAGYGFGNFNDYVYDGYYGNPVSGASFGGRLGYNINVANNLLLGVEAEGLIANESGANPNWSVTYHVNNEITGLARVGFDLGNFMPFAAAGVTQASVSEDYGTAVSASRTGFALGAGIETKLSERLAGRIEYRWADYGIIPEDNNWYSLHVTDSSLRAGLSYYLN